MKITATTINYQIDIQRKSLVRILNEDRCVPSPLYERLMKVPGIEKVDYDGHFGPYIFVELECEHDNGLTWNWIENTIKEYLKSIRGKR